MMTAITFDTLKVAERFEKAGYTAEQAVQATVLAEVMAEELERVTDRFATNLIASEVKAMKNKYLRESIEDKEHKKFINDNKLSIKLTAVISYSIFLILYSFICFSMIKHDEMGLSISDVLTNIFGMFIPMYVSAYFCDYFAIRFILYKDKSDFVMCSAICLFNIVLLFSFLIRP